MSWEAAADAASVDVDLLWIAGRQRAIRPEFDPRACRQHRFRCCAGAQKVGAPSAR